MSELKSTKPTYECICNRPRVFVVCRVCGYYMKGRAKYICSLHPKTIFLNDLNQCPRCKAQVSLLSELTLQ